MTRHPTPPPGNTAGTAALRGWSTDIPPDALAAAVLAAAIIGAAAGLYPATRAARLPPADALRSP